MFGPRVALAGATLAFVAIAIVGSGTVGTANSPSPRQPTQRTLTDRADSGGRNRTGLPVVGRARSQAGKQSTSCERELRAKRYDQEEARRSDEEPAFLRRAVAIELSASAIADCVEHTLAADGR
jgi:hypothetical protein